MFVSATGVNSEIVAACQVLFGPDVEVSHEFLAILRPGGARAAFRRRARETHPDLHPANPDIQQYQARLFQEVATAYRRVSGYCERYSVSAPQESRPSRSAPAPAPRRETVAPSSRRADRSGMFFQGELPNRRMIIGKYLYYRGIIPYHVLLESLTWQRRQRPSIGQLAREWGWLDDFGVVRVLSATKWRGRFGERAREMGLLSDYQVKLLLRAQATRQRRLGEYFIAGGYLSQRRFNLLLAEMQQHNTALHSPEFI